MRSLAIGASTPEAVFDFVADERNEPRYNPNVRRAEQSTTGPIGCGTRFQAEAVQRGRPIPMIIEFTAYERPHRITSATHLATMESRGELTFDPVPAGTRMRWSWDVAPQGLLKMAPPLVARLGRRQEAASWAGPKRYLEG
ncbi:MAG: SRPBCC family protein [Thermomicrobiales bacterium]